MITNGVPVTWSETTSRPQFTIKFQDLPKWGHLLATGWLVWLDFLLITTFFQNFQVICYSRWSQMERSRCCSHLPKTMLREITRQFSECRPLCLGECFGLWLLEMWTNFLLSDFTLPFAGKSELAVREHLKPPEPSAGYWYELDKLVQSFISAQPRGLLKKCCKKKYIYPFRIDLWLQIWPFLFSNYPEAFFLDLLKMIQPLDFTVMVPGGGNSSKASF